jgi:multicomponent Na+:H+ antiporter subunit A
VRSAIAHLERSDVITLVLLHAVLACAAVPLVRWLRGRAFFVLALAPAVAFGWLLAQSAVVVPGDVVGEGRPWIAALQLDLVFRLGTLQWVLALLVAGVGGLVLCYCRWYFGDDEPPARTGGLLVAFAGAMFGLVTADNLLLLYVFWEVTTVLSYLLIGHYPTRQANRRAALTALLVTTFGGLAMLVGIVLLGAQYGTFSISAILVAGAPAQPGPVVVVAVVLLLVGALSKSALVPFHFWLPGAMAAPTPVSAYLHAAAMVKAGVYLVALLAPAFAGVPGWRLVTAGLGAATMIIGGWRALRQYDLKLLLAYGTVSQLGFLIAVCGLGTRSGLLAGVAMIISHALFKAALFLVVGIVDHSAGTRDLRQLSGLGARMPVLAGAALLAGASMAAVPPLIGFTAKEAAFESLVYLMSPGSDQTGIAPLSALLLMAALVAGSALTVAYTLRFCWGAFARKRLSDDGRGEAPASTPNETLHPVSVGFVAAPVVLAVLSLVGGFLGGPITVALTPFADTSSVGEPSHGIALWHGLTLPLAMSVAALTAGFVMFVFRERVTIVQTTFPHLPRAEGAFQATLRGVDRLAVEVTGRTQRGSLPLYLGVIFAVLVLLPGWILLRTTAWPAGLRWWDSVGQLGVAVVIVVAAFLAVRSRRRLRAVVLVGVTGYGTGMLFALHGAPDLALTQVLVETVSLVVFVLVLRRLPARFSERPVASTPWWRIGLACAVGLTVPALMVITAGARSTSPVSEALYEASYEFGYGRNIVNVILVDTRAWDTLGEISVLVAAAVGVANLIFLHRRDRQPGEKASSGSRWRNRSRRYDDQPRVDQQVWLRGAQELSPARRSLIFAVAIRLLLPVMVVLALFLLLRGHNDPGGGFAGGIVAGLAVLFLYLAGGSLGLEDAAPVRAGGLLGVGLLIAAVSTLLPTLVGGRIAQSYDLELQLPVLGEMHLVSSVLFDVGVFVVVIGFMLDIARSLGTGIDRQVASGKAPDPGAAPPQPLAVARRSRP